jgi:hypothetical protein
MPELTQQESELEQLRLQFNALINERPQLADHDMQGERWTLFLEWFYQLSDAVAAIDWARIRAAKRIEVEV